MTKQVAIIDGGGANIASLKFALERIGATGTLTQDHEVIRSADRVILPGVGAAESAMTRLRAAGLHTLIPQLTQPVLGICLGMQLLFDGSDEDDADCLCIVRGRAQRFIPQTDMPVPHMGWNRVEIKGQNPLLADIDDGSHFYFVHSFAVDVVDDTVGVTQYSRPFTSVVHKKNFHGTQFHPERSGTQGATLLTNFLGL